MEIPKPIRWGSKVLLSMGIFVGGIVGGILTTQSNFGGATDVERRMSFLEERQTQGERRRYEFEERIERKIDRIDTKLDRLRRHD